MADEQTERERLEALAVRIESNWLSVVAGTEHCDWDCPFNPCDPEGM